MLVWGIFTLRLNSFVVILPNQLHQMVRTSFNFPMKFSMKFTTSSLSSLFDWQLRNEIAKFVVNFGNFKRISETVCQKFCETHCNKSYHFCHFPLLNTLFLVKTLKFSWFFIWISLLFKQTENNVTILLPSPLTFLQLAIQQWDP